MDAVYAGMQNYLDEVSKKNSFNRKETSDFYFVKIVI